MFLGSSTLIMISVAPLAGAWIEIDADVAFLKKHKSLPSRERGLKSNLSSRWRTRPPRVAPLAGAWIEILSVSNTTGQWLSLPSRERGLK